MADTLERVGRDLRVSFAYQDEALGLGHAVGCARELVGREPFAVMLPDELMGDSSLLAQMIDVCERTGGSVVGLMEVPLDRVSAYGVVTPDGPLDDEGVLSIATMVEKPAAEDAPSNLIIIGRYVLTPDVFDRIAEVRPGTGGEIQLTDALRMQAEHGPFHGILGDVRRYDTGNPLGWLTAVVELALADPDIGDQFGEWLRTRR
jgi:UTP--glucose-1-phosphate uridylyltransferase